MRFFVTRHGETDWNVLDKVCGRTEAELTDNGRRQAAELADRLADKNIDVIVSSPMKRAYETSRIIAERCGIADIETDDRLIEQDYGIYEGVDRRDQGFLGNKRNFAFRYPNGESMMQVAYRTYGLLEELRKRYCGRNVLIVCHGGVCRVINTYFRDMTNEEFFNYSLENCGVEEYDVRD
ncbi:MAG: histidine phosphatase family protein [Oscillospiraceae bacterium]|nr:histidine phosphatase family protein [Oscillospiraceae bacterium]